MFKAQKNHVLINLDTGCGKSLLQAMVARLAIMTQKQLNVVIFHASENVRDENYRMYGNDGDYCSKTLQNNKTVKRITYLTMRDFDKVFSMFKQQPNLLIILDEVEELIKQAGTVVTYKTGK